MCVAASLLPAVFSGIPRFLPFVEFCVSSWESPSSFLGDSHVPLCLSQAYCATVVWILSMVLIAFRNNPSEALCDPIPTTRLSSPTLLLTYTWHLSGRSILVLWSQLLVALQWHCVLLFVSVMKTLYSPIPPELKGSALLLLSPVSGLQKMLFMKIFIIQKLPVYISMYRMKMSCQH